MHRVKIMIMTATSKAVLSIAWNTALDWYAFYPFRSKKSSLSQEEYLNQRESTREKTCVEWNSWLVPYRLKFIAYMLKLPDNNSQDDAQRMQLYEEMYMVSWPPLQYSILYGVLPPPNPKGT